MPDPANKVALDIQSKFELYLLGLVFTVAGLSIESSDFSGSPISRGAELLSWLLFLVSGMLGLWRFRWVSPLLTLYADIRQREETLRTVQAQPPSSPVSLDDGRTVTAANAAALLQVKITQGNTRAKELNSRVATLAALHYWTFLVGLCVLLVARGYDQGLRLYRDAIASTNAAAATARPSK